MIERSLPFAAAVAALASVVSCGGSGPTPGRPNVIVLMADDQAAGTLGVLGHPVLETPSIDRLARDGALFRNAFVTTSLCSPSRASFLTGQWVRAHGIVTNSQPLDPRAVTYATELSRAGYETAYFGKWHMGVSRGPRPGFEKAASYDGQGSYQDCVFHVDGERVETEGFVDDVTTDFLLEFLREPRERPFLAHVGFKSTHGPREPAARHESLYADAELAPPKNANRAAPFPRRREWNRLVEAAGVPDEEYELPSDWAVGFDRGEEKEELSDRLRDAQLAYYRLVAGLDDNVGRILSALDELGLSESTHVVYTSDNGFSNGEHGLSGKCSAYEESMKVVFAMRGPWIVPNATRDELILNVDLAPTLLDLCGVAIPASMQGRSFAPLLRGEPAEWRTEFLYEYYRESDFVSPWSWGAHAVPTLLALRTDDAKLIVYEDHAAWTELFRLDRDPHEMVNVAATDPDRASMMERLEQLDAELGKKPRPPKR